MKTLARLCLIAGCLVWSAASHATQLINFPFNEGQGVTTTDTASGLTGFLGVFYDPAVDYVDLTASSPSGVVGDGSITTHGKGFLGADDSANAILAITNGPITLEAWVYIPPIGTNTPGIVAYGSSYKMGLRGGVHVFTLFGLKDITNNAVPFIADSVWTHLVTAWEPGVGVHFYVDGVHSFTEYTNSAVARTPLNNILSIGSEGLGNNWVGSLDRVRIHNALLNATQLDNDAANPKPPIPGTTLVSYNFNEAAFPSTNAILPAFPTVQAHTLYPTNSHLWTNETPSGLAGDFALAFLTNTPVKDSVTVDYGSTPINLGANNTNYTLQAWVKMPAEGLEERRVIYRQLGPAPRVALSINANRTLHSTVFGTADFTTSVAVPNDNRWHHVAVVMTNFAQLHFYLDGILRQTVNRTQTGVASSGGTANLLIGKESETRYFRGILDRVIINNDALTASTIDYPAIPGLPTFATFAAHPVAVATNLGSDVIFNAVPTSSTAASYQWVYRTNLADAVGVMLSGKTSTTLSLDDITTENLGFYSLVVSNEVGITESYSAQLSLAVDLSPKLIDFEAPTYISGLLDGQDGWTTDVNQDASRVLTVSQISDHLQATGRPIGETVHSGSQAHLFTGPGLAMNSFRTFTGLETETNVTLELWFRALAPGNTGAPIGNVFLRMQTAASVNAAGFRVGPNLSIDYGLVSGAWVPTGLVADPATWYRITMQLNYTARTYDFLVDGVKMNTNPIPFYTGTSDKFQRINLFKGAGQSGIILDDLNVFGPAVAPQLGIRKTESGIVLFWPSSATGYVLEATGALPAVGPWTPVSHSTVGNENQATVQPGTGNQFYRLKK